MSVHIGKEIEKLLKEQGRSEVWLAERIHRTRSGVCRMLKRESIDTGILKEISDAVGYNFFELYVRGEDRDKYH